MPLHMAVKAGQASQVELLIVYGADLTAKDSKGNTVHDIAKQNKHTSIADRLIEATYDVTDRLAHFLMGKYPDHGMGQHLLIPDQNGCDISEQLKIARGKLQLVPNKMFEELVMDLYDEVDRRETEASESMPFFFQNKSRNILIYCQIYSLGNKCIKSGNWCGTIFADKSPFECNTKSRTTKIGSIQSK